MRAKFLSAIAALLTLLMLSACGTSQQSTDNTSANTTTAEPLDTSSPSDQTTAESITVAPVFSEPLPEFVLTQNSVVENNIYSKYDDFNALSAAEILVPGIDQKIVPQGMDIWQEQGWIIMSGYFSDASVSDCSMIALIDIQTGKTVAEYKLKNTDGSNHTSHAGGVAVTSKNIFIANGSKLYRIPLTQLSEAGRQGELCIVEEIKVPVRASFCNYSGGYLWVGDFYYGTSYPTDEFRHMKNRAGKMYYAWSVGYALDESAENEISSDKWSAGMEFATPDVVLSIDQKIQGMAVVSDNYIALSQSYGRKNNSSILLYQNVLNSTPHTHVTLNGVSVPLWFLDSKTEVKSYTAPPMSEGLAARDGKLYILFESAAEKYRLDGGKNSTDRVWVMQMP